MATIDLGKVKFNFVGDWSNSGTYVVGDVVQHANGMWICKKPIIGDSTDSYAPGFLNKGYKDLKTVEYDQRQSIEQYDNDMGSDVQFSRGNEKTFEDSWNVKVADDGSGTQNVYFIDGHKVQNITLTSGYTYRFYQQDPTNYNHPLGISTTQDGTHGGGTQLADVKYFRSINNNSFNVDDSEVTWSAYQTAIQTSLAVFNEKQNYLEFTPDNTNTTLYFYCAQHTGMYSTSTITVNPGWSGYQYWDNISHSINYRGNWDSSTQYYFNDLVSYNGAMFKALKDSKEDKPTQALAVTAKNESAQTGGTKNGWKNNWQMILQGPGSLPRGAGVWGPNMGPMDWPYAPVNRTFNTVYRNKYMITNDGEAKSISNGTNGAGWNNSYQRCYMSECNVQPTHGATQSDTWNIEKGMASQNGNSRSKNRNRSIDQRTPKWKQIEYNYGSSFHLDETGNVYTLGYGGHGQNAGDFGSEGYPHWIQMPEDKKIIKIAMNSENEDSTHTKMALTEDGHVVVWGYNGYGQCATSYDGQSQSNVYMISKEYFDGKRVIDIAITGDSESTVFARTSDDQIYGWGYNASGVLGQNNTTHYFRPVLIPGWNPATNGGLRQWHVSGSNGSIAAYILDGNGYMWHSGYNGYGNAGGTDTTNHQGGWVKSTANPGGNIVDIWPLWWNGYNTTWMRDDSGNTWTCGYGANYFVNGTGTNSTVYPPTQLDKVKNLKHVIVFGSYSNTGMVMFLQDDGKLLSTGYNNYYSTAHPIWGNSNGEDGTYKPYHCYIPAGTKIKWFWLDGNYQSTNYFGPQAMCITESGTLHHWGFSGYSTNGSGFLAGHHQWGISGSPGGTMVQGGMSR